MLSAALFYSVNMPAFVQAVVFVQHTSSVRASGTALVRYEAKLRIVSVTCPYIIPLDYTPYTDTLTH